MKTFMRIQDMMVVGNYGVVERNIVRDKGIGTKGQVPCPKGEEKQADSSQAITCFSFLLGIPKS
jgi:hypothetical protein